MFWCYWKCSCYIWDFSVDFFHNIHNCERYLQVSIKWSLKSLRDEDGNLYQLFEKRFSSAYKNFNELCSSYISNYHFLIKPFKCFGRNGEGVGWPHIIYNVFTWLLIIEYHKYASLIFQSSMGNVSTNTLSIVFLSLLRIRSPSECITENSNNYLHY